MSSCFCRLSFSRLFPFGCDHCLSPRRVCVSTLCGLSTSGALCPLWFFSFLFFFFFFFFFYCAVGGRLSLYSFSRLPLIIPLSSVPDKSLNCTTPPSVTDFTSYGPNQCILSFPGCCNDLLSYISTRSPSLNVFFLMCLSCQDLSLAF
jgi:hypothetical protein